MITVRGQQLLREAGAIVYDALANPALPFQVAAALGLPCLPQTPSWVPLLRGLVEHSQAQGGYSESRRLKRLKQWLKLASRFGDFRDFDSVKRVDTEEEFFAALTSVEAQVPLTLVTQ